MPWKKATLGPHCHLRPCSSHPSLRLSLLVSGPLSHPHSLPVPGALLRPAHLPVTPCWHVTRSLEKLPGALCAAGALPSRWPWLGPAVCPSSSGTTYTQRPPPPARQVLGTLSSAVLLPFPHPQPVAAHCQLWEVPASALASHFHGVAAASCGCGRARPASSLLAQRLLGEAGCAPAPGSQETEGARSQCRSLAAASWALIAVLASVMMWSSL